MKNGDTIEIKHLRLVLCPPVPSHRLKQAAMPKEPTDGDDPGRCVMADLFDVTSEPGTGSSKSAKIESWLWSWAIPRQLSLSLRTPEVVRSWIRGWSTRDNDFISVLTNQALGVVAAYLSLRYATLLLGLYSTLDSSFQMSIHAAFEAFSQGTPAGVKLHIELATLLAYVTHLSGLMRFVLSFLLESIACGETAFVSLLSLAAFILGFKVYLGCVSDAFSLSLHLHWAIINYISTYIFHYHLIALKYSWNIMRRGKKPRKDEDQETPISIEHIVAGVLLFVPLLALFPTTGVFHGLTLMASTATSLPSHIAALILSRITRMRSKETPQRIAVTPLHCSDAATVYELSYL
jgi:glycopeptide antibiotics resistance protein